MGFFTAMLLVFFQTVNDREPTWQTDKSVIGTNPGMGFRPRPEEKNIESTLIWFRAGTFNGNWQKWVERLEDFVKVRHLKFLSSLDKTKNCSIQITIYNVNKRNQADNPSKH